MRILYVTPEISSPPSNGGEIRKWNILQGLLKAGETDVLYFAKGNASSVSTAFDGCGKVFSASREHFLPSARNQRLYESTLGRGLLTLSSILPLEYRGANHALLQKRLKTEIDFSSYHMVWFATARTSFPLGKLDIPVQILDGDDYSYVREWLLLRSSPGYGAKIWNYLDVAKLWWWERGFPRRFSAVLRCSRQDKERHPGGNVEVVPNGTTVPLGLNRTPGRRVLFVGQLDYIPNRNGVEWFLENVWSRIRKQVPGVELDLIGRFPPPSIASKDGVDGIHVHGYVENLEPYYERSGLSVVPLHVGGGTRLKILEALARAVPVVSTTVGAYGIDANGESGLTRGDTADDFAEACVSHLINVENGYERALLGRELVRKQFDWKTIQQQVTELALQYGLGIAVKATV